jgi:hypothetical protein
MKPAITRILTVITIGLLLAACTKTARKDTIGAALLATNAVRDGFVQYDDTTQAKIVAEATSLEEGKAKLKEYREKRAKVLALFPVAYYSIAAAAQANDDASFAKMKTSLKALLDAVMPLLGGVL